jgi:hypothetical protein
MKVRMLLVAELDVPADSLPSASAAGQQIIDTFRENVLPAAEHEIGLYRATRGDFALADPYRSSYELIPVVSDGELFDP